MNTKVDLSSTNILVVEDEEMLAWSIAKELKGYGATVKACTTAKDAELSFNTVLPDLVVCDISLPDGNGLELLEKWRLSHPNMPVILMTAHGGLESAVAAVKLHAFDYLQKPFQMSDLTVAVCRAAEISHLRQKITSFEGKAKNKEGLTIVGETSAIATLRKNLQKIANSKTDTILIHGDTGTGKELAARAIHEWGAGRKNNFVEINCASIPAALLESELFGHEKGAFTDAKQRKLGLFEIAGSGTLFLDEIGEMPIELQPKLLRVLEQRSYRRVGGTKEIEFKGKIVAATNRDLRLEVREQRFRADLYYRLNVIQIKIPKLADHVEDVNCLASFFAKKFSQSLGLPVPTFSGEALKKLKEYNWPGNIRELSNVIQRAMVLNEPAVVGPSDLELDPIMVVNDATSSENVGGAVVFDEDLRIPDTGISLEKLERSLLVQALERTHHNQSKAASLLHISRHTMRYRLEKHGLL